MILIELWGYMERNKKVNFKLVHSFTTITKTYHFPHSDCKIAFLFSFKKRSYLYSQASYHRVTVVLHIVTTQKTQDKFTCLFTQPFSKSKYEPRQMHFYCHFLCSSPDMYTVVWQAGPIRPHL